MRHLKNKIDQTAPIVIEKIGRVLNPTILNFKEEKHQLLIFYFHGLYTYQDEKEYHHVSPQNNITVDQLEEFITYFLHNNYQFISLEDLYGKGDSEKPGVMMTFDDGYYNNSLMVNILEEFQVPALFFISAANVIENKSYWWDIIYKFRAKQGSNLNLIRKEQEHLKKLHHSQIDEYIVKNFGREAFIPWSDIDRPFSPGELKEITKNPLITIGNHTMNHTILPLYSDEEIIQEIGKCNQVLFEITGEVPKSISYPNGNFDERIIRLTQDMGFDFAFTTIGRKNYFPIQRKGNTICLDRFMPEPRSVTEYASFCRLNYSPNSLYTAFKKKINFMKI